MPELTTSQSVLLTDLALCVNHYRLFTPGTYVCLQVPVVLDAASRVVPGLVAMVNHGRLKQCEPLEDGFQGPPNFVLDVFTEGELAEYDRRRQLFERFGVTEYVGSRMPNVRSCIGTAWSTVDFNPSNRMPVE
jgi:hypothetical protein